MLYYRGMALDAAQRLGTLMAGKTVIAIACTHCDKGTSRIRVIAAPCATVSIAVSNQEPLRPIFSIPYSSTRGAFDGQD